MSTLTQELETVRDWLRYAVSRFVATGLFFGHGTTNAYDEAAYLVLHTLHLPLDRLEPFLEARLSHAEREEVLDVIAAASTSASRRRISRARRGLAITASTSTSACSYHARISPSCCAMA